MLPDCLVPMLPLRPQTNLLNRTLPSQTPTRSQLPKPRRATTSRRPLSQFTNLAHLERTQPSRLATPCVAKTRKHSGPQESSLKKQPHPFEAPGRFDRDFVEVDRIGAGEFGSALKVRYKDDPNEDRVFAVKISKRFEGSRHR